MKPYTEEQIKKIWKAGQKYWETSGTSITLEELLEQLKPIELPSDEEIENRAKEYVESKWEYAQDENKESFIEGAKWMRDKIQGGDK